MLAMRELDPASELGAGQWAEQTTIRHRPLDSTAAMQSGSAADTACSTLIAALAFAAGGKQPLGAAQCAARSKENVLQAAAL